MTLNSLSRTYFVTSSLLMLSILATVVAIVQNQSALYQSQEVRYQSYLAADELRQSSDDLTRLARTFAVTGDERYEEQFWDVLAIRDGKRPRPLEYNRIYWDLVAAGQTPRGNGEAKALRQIMQELGFSERELSKLAEAQRNSDDLVNLENIAMNAVKGRFKDAEGGFTRLGQPDLRLARDLLHSDEYHTYKAQIMKPVDDFYALLDQRTDLAVQEHVSRANRYLIILLILVAMGILLALAGYFSFRMRLIRPISGLSDALHQIASEAQDNPRQLEIVREDEVGDVARYYNQAAERFTTMLERVHQESTTARQLQHALDCSSSSILVADAEDRVVYMNASGRQTLQSLEADLKKHNPDFSSDRLQDFHWYDLHPEPSNRQALQGLRRRHEEIIEYSGRSYRLHANPMLGKDREYLGVIAECQNITRKIEAERERRLQVELDKAQQINTRVDSLLDIVDSAVSGDLTRAMTVTGDDAVGRMAIGIEKLLNELRDHLEHIRSSSSALSRSSTLLTDTSSEIGGMATQASNDMSSMTTDSGAMKNDVISVATAMQEMSAAIRQIAGNAGEAASVASEAVNLAQNTDTTVRKLSDSSSAIGNMLKVITSIAEQTNLLALNATIEAARAGDAGKGFAVVANEVKDLAKETARATDEIADIIESIQDNSDNAVRAITSIGQTINKINQIQTDIANSVQEQNATTLEISRNVQNAVSNSDSITRSVENTSAGIGQTQQGVERLHSVSTEISRMADDLRKRIAHFELER